MVKHIWSSYTDIDDFCKCNNLTLDEASKVLDEEIAILDKEIAEIDAKLADLRGEC